MYLSLADNSPHSCLSHQSHQAGPVEADAEARDQIYRDATPSLVIVSDIIGGLSLVDQKLSQVKRIKGIVALQGVPKKKMKYVQGPFREFSESFSCSTEGWSASDHEV